MPDIGPSSEVNQAKFREKFEELRRHLGDAKRRDGYHQYVPLGDIEMVLNKSNLSHLIRYSKFEKSDKDIEKAIGRLLQRDPEYDSTAYRYLRAFATLIDCEAISYIQQAIRFFLQYDKLDQVGNQIWRPPEDNATRASGKQAFYNSLYDGMGQENEVIYQLFFDRKKVFCALILKEGDVHQVSENVIPPFFLREDEVIGEGGAGKVYRVIVGKRHWIDKLLSNSEDMPLAIKRFNRLPKDTTKARFKVEFDSLMKLKSASVKSRNVMLPLASLILGQERLLIYDLAETNFEKYMWTREPALHNIRAVLRNATDLVGALAWIHEYQPGQSICHGDIKPLNILICKTGPREIWKLADFDRSLEKPTFNNSDESKFRMKGGLNTYRDPESQNGTRSDVWAMACMISLILTWLDNGRKGIGEFMTKRNMGDPDNDDVFYKREEPQSDYPMSPMVKEWFQSLVERSMVKEKGKGKMPDNGKTVDLSGYSDYVGDVVSYLSNKVFVSLQKRAYAHDFYSSMAQAYASMQNRNACFEETEGESQQNPVDVTTPTYLPLYRTASWSSLSTESSETTPKSVPQDPLVQKQSESIASPLS